MLLASDILNNGQTNTGTATIFPDTEILLLIQNTCSIAFRMGAQVTSCMLIYIIRWNRVSGKCHKWLHWEQKYILNSIHTLSLNAIFFTCTCPGELLHYYQLVIKTTSVEPVTWTKMKYISNMANFFNTLPKSIASRPSWQFIWK